MLLYDLCRGRRAGFGAPFPCMHGLNTQLQRLGWVIVPKVFLFTSTVIFPISYVPKVNLNQKYWIKIEIYYGFKPIKVLYYELLRGKKDIWILLQKSMKELNYWLQWVKVCLLGPPRLPKKIWGLWANPLYGARGPQIGPLGPIEGVGPQIPNFFRESRGSQ